MFIKDSEIERYRQKLLALSTELHEFRDVIDNAIQPANLDQICVGGLSRIDAIQVH